MSCSLPLYSKDPVRSQGLQAATSIPYELTCQGLQRWYIEQRSHSSPPPPRLLAPVADIHDPIRGTLFQEWDSREIERQDQEFKSNGPECTSKRSPMKDKKRGKPGWECGARESPQVVCAVMHRVLTLQPLMDLRGTAG
jgi:hypothetical protein